MALMSVVIGASWWCRVGDGGVGSGGGVLVGVPVVDGGAERRRLAGGWTDTAWKRRSRRLLLTTNTEENAIAAPAISGLSSPAMASGSAATL